MIMFVFCLLNYITSKISDRYNCSESICWVPFLKSVNICWACVSSVPWVAAGPPVLPQAGSGKTRRQGAGIGAEQGTAAPRRFSRRRRKHNHLGYEPPKTGSAAQGGQGNAPSLQTARTRIQSKQPPCGQL